MVATYNFGPVYTYSSVMLGNYRQQSIFQQTKFSDAFFSWRFKD